MSKFTESSQLSDGIIWGKTIPFTNLPKQHQLEINFVMPRVFNYSQFFDSLSEEEKNQYISPCDIKTGDVVVANGYVRGVGSRYAVWLHAGLFSNPETKPAHGGETIQPDPSKRETVSKNEENGDPFAFGLPADTLRKVRDLLAAEDIEDYEAWDSELKATLKDFPDLYNSINSDGEGRVQSSFASLVFEDDIPKVFEVWRIIIYSLFC